MQNWQGISAVNTDGHPNAVTIGKFDGIHLGHQALLAATVSAAKANGLGAVAVTFNRHPDALFNPNNLRQPLIGNLQKAELIAATGISALLTLNFDEALASLSPEEFVKQVLVTALNVKVCCVGDDFKFGAKGAGQVEDLKTLGAKYGFEVVVVGAVVVDGSRVSSSHIRDLLDLGDVAGAARQLGRPHVTTGMVEHGLKLGRQLGFPTANLSRDSEGYLPVDGVYAGWLFSEGVRYPAALSVGKNETIQAVPRLIEAHVLDAKDLDLYDKVVSVEYVSFVRPAIKFDGLDSLIAAIQADCDQIAELLNAHR